jgi:hypothetical protein
MEFHPLDPIDANSAEHAVWKNLKHAFEGQPLAEGRSEVGHRRDPTGIRLADRSGFAGFSLTRG